MKTIISLLAAVALLARCATPDVTPSLTSQSAKLRVEVCSRGCYQYVLALPTTAADSVLYPINLTEAMQKQAFDYGATNRDGLPVLFSGELLADKTQISHPGPTDVPMDAYKARNVRLTSIMVQLK
ncbi:hypothetical protein J2I47_20025 [Fibrella sp. HMF5335]|uniref:Lipoprotein n=1 Tax=Fibrella rubiginis TaxID=2817060 RepID=A0A939GID2_9BACT|nr:hypothetical protein [Fibrella rubiginis]MBO0938851.1 hypothetical protein [Fibrella rubiginis]